jgi:hypothetical protein
VINVGLTLDGVLERGMQVIDNLGEHIGGTFVAVFINEENLQTPFPHGELLHWRGFIAKI